MIKAISKHGGILALAAFLCVLLIVLTHSLTKEAIASQRQAQRLQSLNEVIPKALHDNMLTQSCTLVRDASLDDKPVPAYIATIKGELSALAIEVVAPDGYGGDIRVLLGIDKNEKVLGMRVLEHNETPGLGDKVDTRISDWALSFVGRSLATENDKAFAVKKDGGTFDQFTGATITPRAVVNASRKALWYLKTHRAQLLAANKNCEAS